MMSISQYLAFHTLIETGNFTETGLKLNLTQSSISHSINKLEEDLGLSLIIRSRNNIKLTNEGEVVYQYIQNILQQQEQLYSEVANLKKVIGGTIIIGTLPSVSLVLLPKVLAYFEEHHPELDIRLMEGDYDQIEEWIDRDMIDLGFITKPNTKTLEFHSVFTDELVCIMSSNHPLTQKSELQLSLLKNERWIMPSRKTDRDVSKILSDAQIVPNIVYEIAVDQVILTMVNEGLGISILPSSLLVHAPKPLVQKKLSSSYIREVGIAHKRMRHLSPAAKMFIHISQQTAK
ncbi:LysR family transcriptional regulator [Alkalihalobacillus trypoxylicola]|uniref:LysR family transcriptional regulator n=2 Tax=Alkalihalobacillus trypoxylicola TaxID=519424 RepID=A0A161PJP3_9BACI|nr:LysR family transcriptional regulator [Alkalihalobacillus trypoxylicola]